MRAEIPATRHADNCWLRIAARLGCRRGPNRKGCATCCSYHACPHGRGRHARSTRRRLPPLFRGPLLARAALRKNALRSGAACSWPISTRLQLGSDRQGSRRGRRAIYSTYGRRDLTFARGRRSSIVQRMLTAFAGSTAGPSMPKALFTFGRAPKSKQALTPDEAAVVDCCVLSRVQPAGNCATMEAIRTGELARERTPSCRLSGCRKSRRNFRCPMEEVHALA